MVRFFFITMVRSLTSGKTFCYSFRQLSFFVLRWPNLFKVLLTHGWSIHSNYRNLTLKECEDDTHTPEMGTWESSETLENSKFNYRGQNTSP